MVTAAPAAASVTATPSTGFPFTSSTVTLSTAALTPSAGNVVADALSVDNVALSWLASPMKPTWAICPSANVPPTVAVTEIVPE